MGLYSKTGRVASLQRGGLQAFIVFSWKFKMDQINTATSLTATFLIVFAILSSADGTCELHDLPKTSHCVGKLQCSKDINIGSLIRLWACRKTEGYDYDRYYGYRRPTITYDEEYRIHVTLIDIEDESNILNNFRLFNDYNDHIDSMTIIKTSIKTVPQEIYALSKATKINISRNMLESITTKLFRQVRNLQTLDASFNNIAVLFNDDTDSPFSSQITYIDLSHNLIEMIPSNHFERFPELIHLDLSYNLIENIDILTFEGTTQLQILWISYNKLTTIGVNFARFVNLKELHLGYNQLTKIDENDFKTMKKLTKLDLSNNKIQYVNEMTFQNLADLIELDLSTNEIKIIQKTLFKTNSNLQFLNLMSNKITKIEPGSFKDTKINDFGIKNNSLTGSLDKETFQGIQTDELDLSGGNISSLGAELFVDLRDHLKILNFSSNSISDIHNTSFNDLTNLLNLDLSNNKLQNLTFDTSSLKNVSVFYAKNNQITKITRTLFENLTKIKEIDLSNNVIDSIQADSFTHNSQLELLILKGNPLPNIIATHTFKGLSSLTSLDLTNSAITAFESESFFGMDSLLTLNISHAKLAVLDYKTFAGTGSIEVLDLSNNMLDVFSVNNSDISRVKDLNLNYNLLTNIKGSTFDNLTNLQDLHLENNRIVNIEDESLRTLTNLTQLSLLSNQDIKFNATIFTNLTSLLSVSLRGIKKAYSFKGVNSTCISNLDLSSCEIVDINLVSVFEIKTLVTLKLNSNKIKFINKITFQNLKLLSILDLSDNMITDIKPGSFVDNYNLVHLHLHNNMLSSLQYGVLDGLEKLDVLDLSNNALHYFTANLLHNVARLDTVILDNNMIENLDLKEFDDANVEKISIGNNRIPCDFLVNYKKNNVNKKLSVTTMVKKIDTENIDGITCRSTAKFENITISNNGTRKINESALATALINTMDDFRLLLEKTYNKNESKSNDLERKMFDNVSISINNFLQIANESQSKSNMFFEKLIGINNRTNLYLNDIEESLRDVNKVSHKNVTYEEEKNKKKDEVDIEKVVMKMFEEERQSLKINLKNMVNEMSAQNVKNQYESQTSELKDSGELKSALYFIAVCLAVVLCVIVLIFGYIYFKFKSNLIHNNILHSSRQPIANVMEME